MLEEDMNTPQFLRDLPPQFEPLRSFLPTDLLPYIKIIEEAVGNLNFDFAGDPLELWQSKIGGYPYLPKGTSYPVDRETGEMMMFLMQVNCAELPQIDGLPLPQHGILQFYLGLDVPMCALSPEKHRILYFPEISHDKSNLVTDFSFTKSIRESHEWYEQVYALKFSAEQDSFWEARYWDEQISIPDDLMELSEDFNSWISDYNDENQTASIGNKLGGYVESLPSEEVDMEGIKGRLLLELQHEFNSDDHFYFFIEDSDLVNLDFSKVGSCFWRM
ncbi:YwqG family protein [Calothrix sp. UHCC 0171]|uniref:YwqG family protein n=1 Tax=Calothrix sp. UHCC 0171 TaxID=3110245 RepID=UPI002B21DDAA|nr:YwqG family protein [Calothrix sp. UHCC 0171]MEA5574309.1 YwqG family protein [Calothrix sp. UHCC 0171]